MKKICTGCGLEKEISCFYKKKQRGKDSFCAKCKDCERIAYREKRLRNPETFKQKDKRFYENNREKVISKRMRWYHENKHKVSAHEKVKRALLNGELVKKVCSVCGDKKSLAHHEDYTKPLSVIWLCSKHHMTLHHGK